MDVIIVLPLSTVDIHIDERTQAIVLTEIAARIFIASGAIANIANRIETDESSLPSLAPQAQGLLCSPNRAGLTAMLMHDNLWLLAVCAETGLDEVHLGFHDRHIVLGATLQYKARTQRSQVRDAGYIEKHVFR